MDTNRTYELLGQWLAAFKSGNGTIVMDGLAPDVEFVTPSHKDNSIIPYLGTKVGKAEVAEALALRDSLVETMTSEVRGFSTHGDRGWALIYSRERYRPSSREFEVESAHQFHFDDSGRIKHWRSFFDPCPQVAVFRTDLDDRLIKAAWSGDVEAARTLIEHGANPSKRDRESGLTALMIAAGTANVQLLRLLLDSGADLFAVDSAAGASALHKACQGGSLEVVRTLVEAGAPVDWIATSTGHTPVMDAIWFKRLDLVGYLLEKGAGLQTPARYGFSIFEHIAFELKVNVSGKEAFEAMDRMVKQRQGADREAVDQQRLMAAVVAGDLEGVKQLIAGGAEVDERAPMLNSFNDAHSPLLVAARDGHTAIVVELLRAGADVNAVEPTFLAVPLHKAAYNGHADIVALLVEQPGVRLDVQGLTNGYTPLHDSLWHGHADCAQILIEAGARLDQRGHDGKTPLDLATEVLGSEHAVTAMIRWRLEAVAGDRPSPA